MLTTKIYAARSADKVRYWFWGALSICLFPVILKNFGVNFQDWYGSLTPPAFYLSPSLSLPMTIRLAILEWSVVGLAVFSLIFGFLLFKLKKTPVDLILAIAVFWAGYTDTLPISALQLFDSDGGYSHDAIWSLSRTISGLILLFGIGLILVPKEDQNRNRSVVVITLAGAFLFLFCVSLMLPMLFDNIFLQRFFGEKGLSWSWNNIFPLTFYSIAALTIVPVFLKRYTGYVSLAIWLSIIFSIFSCAYMTIGSMYYPPYTFIAAVIKTLSYFVIFSGFYLEFTKVLEEKDVHYRQILKEQEQMNKLVQLKSAFISKVSHEQRTPIAIVKESINIISDGIVGPVIESQRDFLDTAKKNIERLSRLINDSFDFDRLYFSQMDFNFEFNNINDVIREVVKSTKQEAEAKGIIIKTHLMEKIPAVIFDRDKILQVMQNLVSNAIKFTEKGEVSIMTMPIDAGIHVSVKDTGIGIKPEDVDKLFLIFSWIGGKREKCSDTTGLGLAICKGIIEQHGGSINVETHDGKGSIFYFTLPTEGKKSMKLGEILINEGKITIDDLNEALDLQKKRN